MTKTLPAILEIKLTCKLCDTFIVRAGLRDETTYKKLIEEASKLLSKEGCEHTPIITTNEPEESKTLDEKLREILEDWYPGTQYEDVVPKIKQAFQDEGWIAPDTDKYKLVKGLQKAALENNDSNTVPVMTGKEWYDKLMSEFLKVNHIYTTPDEEDWVAKFTDFVEAAKRASSLERLDHNDS
jgi:hypothetical protein